MFSESLIKASFIITVPFFIFFFNSEIKAQVKYVYHNKTNLKLNRKNSIPIVNKKSVQIIKSNILNSNSTNNISLSGVKIITNRDFKNELSNIFPKNENSSKVEKTTISGVEIILGSENYLTKNTSKSNTLKTIVKNKVVKASTLKRLKPAQKINNNLVTETLFKESPFEETTKENNSEDEFETSTKNNITQETITQEPIEVLEETTIENTTEKVTEVETSTENILSQEIVAEQPTEVLEETVDEETTTKNTIEIVAEVESSTEKNLAQQVIAEQPTEVIEETADEETTIENTTETVTEIEYSTKNNLAQQEITEQPTEMLEETSDEETTTENTTETVEKVESSTENNITQGTIPQELIDDELEEITEPIEISEESSFDKPIRTSYELSLSAKIENELAEKAPAYYTIRVKSVSDPREGIKFLSEIKDNDGIWEEHTFHLFRDLENENITNISIGKFVDKQKAEELMEYLKTKNIKNPSIEKYENKLKPVTNNKPKQEPVITNKSISVNEPTKNEIVKKIETKKAVSSNKNLLDNISTKVGKSDNYFSVQVGANDKISSSNIQGLDLKKEKLFFVNIESGKYAINYGKYPDYGSAHKIALEIHTNGLETAFVTKYKNGLRMKITKSDYLTDNIPKKTISNDISKLGYTALGPNDKGKFIQIGTIYNWDAHNFKSLYDQLERTIYYKVKENNSVMFLVGPLKEREELKELTTIKQLISDAFIKNL